MSNNNLLEKDTIPTSKPNFDLVFGGFKQIEPSAIKVEKSKGGLRRKYPSEVGKLCKNIFTSEEP